MTEMLATLNPRPFLILAALLVGLAVALVAERLQALAGPSASRSLRAYLGERGEEEDVLAALGRRVERWFPTLRKLSPEEDRRWLALSGESAQPARVYGIAGALGLVGLLFYLWAPSLLSLLFFAGMVYYPFFHLKQKAGRIKEEVRRSIPDLAVFMAAEMAAGASVAVALERAVAWGGPMAAIVKEAVSLTQREGRPLFGRRGMEGAFVRVARRYGLPELVAFAAQVDMAAAKGAEGPALMEALARTQIVEQKNRLLREAESLDGKAMPLAILFFFVPTVAIMGVPALLMLLQSL